MISLIEILTSVLLIVGALLMCAGSFGVARSSDFFSRIHLAALPATLGVTTLLLAASIYLSIHLSQLFLKPIIALFILFLSAPLGIEMLARAGYITNIAPSQPYVRDDTLTRDVQHKEAVE